MLITKLLTLNQIGITKNVNSCYYLLQKTTTAINIGLLGRRNKSKSSKDLRQLNRKFDQMIRVKFVEEENRVAIALRCKLDENAEREFNLNRSQDEEIGATFEKLYANYQKHAMPKQHKKQKMLQAKDANSEAPAAEEAPIRLYDTDNHLVEMTTPNKKAWVENYTLRLYDQTFRVCINLPSIEKISLLKLAMAGFPTVAKIECDSVEIERNSIFNWYVSDRCFTIDDRVPLATDKKKKIKVFDVSQVKWRLLEGQGGRAKRMCMLDKDVANHLIRVECIPSDGKREGVAVEAISTYPVDEGLPMNELPMFDRHQFTKERLVNDSFRIMSYNILAGCYSETPAAKEEIFTHCTLDFLDFNYRRVLLLHEIINYNSDIIFLQECEIDFFRDDLMPSLNEQYGGHVKFKGVGFEGEAILYRLDRFKFIKSHDIVITDELKENPIFAKLWKNICECESYKELILKRTNVLQVVQVESIDNPGHHFLLANSHFYFHPDADFLRLIQAIVCMKYLETLKKSLLSSDSNNNDKVKRVGVFFGGDLNSDFSSKAFKYLSTQSIPVEDVTRFYIDYLNGCVEDLRHNLDLSVYKGFQYTNYVIGFQDVLDHLFYDNTAVELIRVIPMPSKEKITEFVALPSKYVPSDHLAIIFDFKMKLD